MKNINQMVKFVEKFTIDNSPQILTALGVTGTITTAVLTAKASFQAAQAIKDAQFRENQNIKSHEFDSKEKAQIVWKFYIPAAGTGVLTVACIISANRIGSRRAAAMAAAYSVSQRAFEEYKEKVIEKLGTPKEQKIRDEIAQDHVDRNPSSKGEIIITGSGEVLCYDKYTGRYFMSSMDALKKAENEVNFYVLHNDYATLNDFYRYIGLDPVTVGEEVGWVCDMNFEILFSTTMSDNDKPCIVIDYQVCGVRRRPMSTLREIDVNDRVIT